MAIMHGVFHAENAAWLGWRVCAMGARLPISAGVRDRLAATCGLFHPSMKARRHAPERSGHESRDNPRASENAHTNAVEAFVKGRYTRHVVRPCTPPNEEPSPLSYSTSHVDLGEDATRQTFSRLGASLISVRSPLAVLRLYRER